MTGEVRAKLKRLVPVRLKYLVKSIRQKASAPPIDDIVIARYRFTPDPVSRLRINFVISNLTRSTTFGGVSTGIDVFLKIAAELSRRTEIDVRVILAEPDRETDLTIFSSRAAEFGFFADRLSFRFIYSRTDEITVRDKDLFLAYSTWMALNLHELVFRQSVHFSVSIRPLLFIIQEYEPQFYAFSSAHMLSREGYDGTDRLWGLFNSSNLYWYFVQQGHLAERAFVFEPVLSDKIASYLDRVGTSERRKRILIYGRPAIARNCWPAVVRGLRRWVEDDPDAASWEIVSAGTAHPPISLGRSMSIVSVGKLSLEDYVAMLLVSSVGISLMASPHPSYPPLEMAHMGLRTITNSYLGKDLSHFHPNIRSISSMTETSLSAAIASACAEHDEPVVAERNPSYLRDEPYPFIAELCSDLLSELGLHGGGRYDGDG